LSIAANAQLGAACKGRQPSGDPPEICDQRAARRMPVMTIPPHGGVVCGFEKRRDEAAANHRRKIFASG
jgi:hypothetical protein